MTARGRVTVVGSFNVDHVWRCAELPVPGQTLSGEYSTGPGGKGFNQATAAARAGAATAFVCALGEDVGAQWARALGAADDIDLHDQRSELPTGTAGIYVDHAGRNSIVIGAGANAALSPEFVTAQRSQIETSAVVLVQLESPVEAVTAALRTARTAGVTTLLNPAPANTAVPATLWAYVDVATPNETEFCAHLARDGGPTVDPESLAGLPDGELHGLCRGWQPNASVVLTLGAAGCFVSHPPQCLRGDADDHYRVPASAVTPVDTTGAGDAFNGALAASLASEPGRAFQAHVRFAGAFAGVSTERAGAALSMPRRDEVEGRFGPF
ncbi:ribokinase [Lysobacter olei]